MVGVYILYILFSFFFLTEEMFPLLTDHSFIPEFHLELKQQGTWENQGMCACVRFAWALVLRTCSQWPNIVGAVEVLEKDEEELDLAVQENVLSFLRHSVVRATNFHQEVCHYFFLSPLCQKYIKIEMKKLICILACALNMKLLKSLNCNLSKGLHLSVSLKDNLTNNLFYFKMFFCFSVFRTDFVTWTSGVEDPVFCTRF